MSEELRKKSLDPAARHFVDLPLEYAFFDDLYEHTAKLPDSEINEFLTDGVIEMWMEFRYAGFNFSVRSRLNDYEFYVNEPDCPEEVLMALIAHFRKLVDR